MAAARDIAEHVRFIEARKGAGLAEIAAAFAWTDDSSDVFHLIGCGARWAMHNRFASDAANVQ